MDYLTTHTRLSPIRLCKLQKRCTRLAAASDNVYQLLAHGRWFTPGTPASSITKTGRHDITEMLLNVALNTKNQIKSFLFPFLLSPPGTILVLFHPPPFSHLLNQCQHLMECPNSYIGIIVYIGPGICVVSCDDCYRPCGLLYMYVDLYVYFRIYPWGKC